MDRPEFKEENVSQIPALQLLTGQIRVGVE